jgi:hypothetical protein
MSSGGWAILVVVGLIAIALAVGGYAMVTGTTSGPAVVTEVVEPAPAVTDEGGLIKNGLQPRPYTAIDPSPQGAGVETPDGFVRVGTDFRPMPVPMS